MSEAPRPWLECVDLHPDVLSDDFSEDVFALDLGSLSDYLTGKSPRSAGKRRNDALGGLMVPHL